MSTGKPKTGKRKAASSTKAPAATKKPRKPRGMVELPEGIVLTDLTKKKWRLGRLIGWGGFGALYLGKLAELAASCVLLFLRFRKDVCGVSEGKGKGRLIMRKI